MSSVGGAGGPGEKPDAAKAKAAKGAFPGPKLVPSGGAPVVSGPAGAKPLASLSKSSASAPAKPAPTSKSSAPAAPASGGQKAVAAAPSSGAQRSVGSAAAPGAKPAASSVGPPGGKAVSKAGAAAPAAKAAPVARPAVSPQVTEFARGMVQAADAASQPGPSTDGDLLPRESVSGLFMRDFAMQGAIALGRAPLGEDEAARIVIEKHIGGEAGRYYDAKVSMNGDDGYVVRLHRLSSEPPFLPEASVEATYKINRKTWQIEQT